MKPFRIRVNRLIDFGAIVTLIGVDAEASKPVTIHVDYRPFDVVWAAWGDVGSKQPIEYAADGLTLTLGVAGEDQIEGALIGEAEILNPASPNRFREALQIVDPGASNPSGIAHAIVAACAEVRREGGSTATDTAVRLMVTQLAWVCRADSSHINDYGQLLAERRRRLTEEPETQRARSSDPARPPDLPDRRRPSPDRPALPRFDQAWCSLRHSSPRHPGVVRLAARGRELSGHRQPCRSRLHAAARPGAMERDRSPDRGPPVMSEAAELLALRPLWVSKGRAVLC